MSQVNMSQLLAEMRRLTAQAESMQASPPAQQENFAALLEASIARVNEAQATASEMAAAFERGDEAASLPEVMIALQKASLSFQAMTEVRNRLVSAYQEVMNMPI